MAGGARDHLGDGNFVIIAQLYYILHCSFLCSYSEVSYHVVSLARHYLLHVMIKLCRVIVVDYVEHHSTTPWLFTDASS